MPLHALQSAEGDGDPGACEGEAGDGGGEVVVEKVVEVPKRLEPQQVEALRAEFEAQARQELQVGLRGGL
jgi:hypothetical protein